MSPEPVAPSPMNSAMRDLAEVIYRRTGGRSVPTFELEPILARLYLAAKIEALESVRGGPCSGEAKAIHSQCIAANLRDTLAKLREEAK